MSHAEICQVCGGSGELPVPIPYSTVVNYKTCHGCYGRGWVEVQDGE